MRKTGYIKTKTLALLLIFSINTSFAQGSEKIYAALLYHVLKNTQWPSSKSGSDIRIGVVGNSKITKYLTAMASSKKIGGKKIVVIKYPSSSEAGSDCHVVYLSASKHSQLEVLMGKAKSNSYLLVTESSGGAKDGAVINFIISGGKPTIELNESQAKANQIKITAGLKKLAKKVG